MNFSSKEMEESVSPSSMVGAMVVDGVGDKDGRSGTRVSPFKTVGLAVDGCTSDEGGISVVGAGDKDGSGSSVGLMFGKFAGR